jgi:hypothetical protein
MEVLDSKAAAVTASGLPLFTENSLGVAEIFIAFEKVTEMIVPVTLVAAEISVGAEPEIFIVYVARSKKKPVPVKLSSASTVKVLEPTVVGVPVIAPVDEFRLSPFGREPKPATILYV